MYPETPHTYDEGRDAVSTFGPPTDPCRGSTFCDGTPTRGMKFRVIQGDVAQESADALVSAAGTSPRMGSGVAGPLRVVGGEALGRAVIAASSGEPSA